MAKQLTQAQRFKLHEHVRDHHGKGMTDAEFAAVATTGLGFPVVASAVATAREIFGIPKTGGSLKDLKQRLQQAEMVARQLRLKYEQDGAGSAPPLGG